MKHLALIFPVSCVLLVSALTVFCISPVEAAKADAHLSRMLYLDTRDAVTVEGHFFAPEAKDIISTTIAELKEQGINDQETILKEVSNKGGLPPPLPTEDLFLEGVDEQVCLIFKQVIHDKERGESIRLWLIVPMSVKDFLSSETRQRLLNEKGINTLYPQDSDWLHERMQCLFSGANLT